MIRQAVSGDAAAIAAIWNPIIAETTATFTTEQKDEAVLAELIADRGEAFVVADEGGFVLGFATYGPFRGGPGYAATAEHSVMLAKEARGRGVGRALLSRLEVIAQKNGIHVMIAGISGENEGAIAFHHRMGFAETARMPEVGRKFGHWLDLVCMQKILNS
ncbi:GNAT family N-acetyltransferase [Alisedimentitalea sp. MJ-SS2]|uniref:GNAT family N-acetyltransferase n=1 Tax=Aliisedimentitalea sp. MJ-SS2 TaxID=3049795 RepID=UPI0029156C91|nr:N-acetyltransferase family protein [Alisedimentitalea sp. MJ-SS2]MDU8926643.1 GNAT family N-acetyltransferase [Alisedimentitalea sp. MJ-SS2]